MLVNKSNYQFLQNIAMLKAIFHLFFTTIAKI